MDDFVRGGGQLFSPSLQVGRDGWHGILTYNVLVDRMTALDILYAPEKCMMRFAWYASIPGDNAPGIDYQENMLFLCHSSVAPELLKRNPTCFCFVPVEENEDLSWIGEIRAKTRVLAFRRRQRFYYYDNLLQVCFANHLLWHREMDRIVYANGTLDELLEASEGVLKNFVCITDTGFNLIAYTHGVKPLCAENQYLVDNKCLSKKSYQYLQESILPLSSSSRKIIVSQPHEKRSFPMLHCPLYIEGQYLFHVTMECCNGSEAACRDVFDELMKRIVSLCTMFWRKTVNIESPWHRVLKALINGETTTSDYVGLQLSQTDIPHARQFRLAIAPFKASMSNQERNEVLSAAVRMNGGCVYPFMYEGNMLVLFYSKKDREDTLSSKVINSTVEEVLAIPFGMHIGCSQAFSSIEDISYAYRQAEIALKYRKAMKREILLSGRQDDICVYPFDHTLKYYLLSGECDRELVEYSFKSSILNKLVEEDEKAGTEIAHLLWIYLGCDRNATETSKRIHVHRNTVLYHIGRIEKRFGLDFSSSMLKDRMILDYIKVIMEKEL